MQSFLEHFIPHYRRYQLIPWQIQDMLRIFQLHPGVISEDLRLVNRMRYQIDVMYEAPIEELLHGEFPPRYRYRHFTIAKKDGTRRDIMEPLAPLKAIQHAIIDEFLKKQNPHPAAIGYRKGLSVADHAWAHAGARTIVTADIQDFFPSTTRYRVRQFWKDHSRNFNDAEVQLLTNLTTYRGSLPQGAPTSPMLSNLVNKELDRRLHKLVSQSGGCYTRYADDIVFSWQMRARPPVDFEWTVRRILREYGYVLNQRKGWQVWSREDEPEITGTVLTKRGGVDVPPTMREIMDQLAQSDDTYDQFRLAGYQGYRQMVVR